MRRSSGFTRGWINLVRAFVPHCYHYSCIASGQCLTRVTYYIFCIVADGVIIETTGLADPAPVVQTLFVDDTISEMYSLDSSVKIVVQIDQ